MTLAHSCIPDLQGSRDCRAVRKLDFVAGRRSLQLDYHSPLANGPAKPVHTGDALHADSAPSASHFLASHNELVDDDPSAVPAPFVMGPRTPFPDMAFSIQHQQQARPADLASGPASFAGQAPTHQHQPLLQQPAQLHSLHGASPLATSSSHWPQQGSAAAFPNYADGTQHAQPSYQHLQQLHVPQPVHSQPAWNSAAVPEWQLGARILPEQPLALPAQQPQMQPLSVCSTGADQNRHTASSPSRSQPWLLQNASTFSFAASKDDLHQQNAQQAEPAQQVGSSAFTAPPFQSNLFQNRPAAAQAPLHQSSGTGNVASFRPSALTPPHRDGFGHSQQAWGSGLQAAVPFASSAQGALPLGFPTPSGMCPSSFPACPVSSNAPELFQHPFGAHQPPDPPERRLFSPEATASPRSWTRPSLS